MSVPERMTLRNVYLYLVCLITLVIAVFAAVQLVRSTVGLAYPDPGYFGYFPDSQKNGPTEEEVRKQQEVAEQSQRRQSVLELVGSGTTLLIAGPLYVYHWRRVQSELPRRADAADPPAVGP